MVTPFAAFHESIHKVTAKEIIRDKLVSLIASGILVVGDELPSERELAAMLSVSRESVRGAIQRLAAEGIVQISQGSRTRITNINVDISVHRIGVTNPNAINGYDLESVHGSRLLVETAVVADAARHISEEDLCRLETSLDTQRLAFADPVRFLICDREFHLTIYNASSNRLLADFVVDLYTYMLDHRRSAMAKPGAIERSLLDHEAIVRALNQRDPDGVSAAFRQHILRIRDTTIAVGSEAFIGPEKANSA